MFWADSLGAKYIFERLDAWSKIYGDFFKPCSYLEERAAKGISLVRFIHSHTPTPSPTNFVQIRNNMEEVVNMYNN